MFAELTREELAAGLDHVALEILEEAGIFEPPIDAIAMAQTLGIAVALDDRQRGRARYVRFGDRWSNNSHAAILLRPEPRFERRQWAVAHEIGEHVAHRVFARWGADPAETPPNAREQVANWLAGRLLLPTGWFADHAAASNWDLTALKAQYNTASHELIARRMLECRPSVVITIFDHRRISFRQSNLANRVPPPLPLEIECWTNVHDHGRPAKFRRGPNRIQGWPIHEIGWQREILRLEFEEWEVAEDVDTAVSIDFSQEPAVRER
jgi:Zn-dependent peptidase ImmA (M78 family)